MTLFSNKSLTERIKTLGLWLVIFQIAYGFIIKLLIEVFSLSERMNYLLDLNVAVCFTVALYILIYEKRIPVSKSILYIAASFVFIVLISWGINGFYSPLRLAIALRNIMRGPVWGFSAIIIVSENDRQKINIIVYITCIANLIVSLYQFMVMGKKNDYLNGLFGVQSYNNLYVNVLLILGCTLAMCDYLSKKINLAKTLGLWAVCLANATLTEIKAFYLEFVIVLAVLFFSTKGKKKWIVFGGATAAVVLGMILTAYLYPLYRDFFTNPERLKSYLFSNKIQSMVDSTFFSEEQTEFAKANYPEIYNYCIENDLAMIPDGRKLILDRMNRFSAPGHVLRGLNTTTPSRLWGIGLGNAQAFSQTSIRSEFADTWTGLGYTISQFALMLLENGIIGVISYVSFYVWTFGYGIREKMRGRHYEGNLAIVLSTVCGFLYIYNATFQMDAVYPLMFYMLYVFRTEDRGGNHGQDSSIDSLLQ